MKHLFRWPQLFLFGLLPLALPLALVAQEQEEDEEIYELSPFTIAEEEDVGYLATTTLAGTRLKTPLRDIGAAVTVLTQELFEDTGATDAESILSYVSNAEVGGVQGNFLGVGSLRTFQRAETSGIRINPQGNQRIRGLASASLTRGFFLTNIPFDTYNTSRTTVNRGPNSLLFGIGEPGGVINNNVKNAVLGRSFGEISVRIGERNSHRETFDYNQELIAGRLAVRVMGLNEDTQHQQRPAFEADERVTLSLEAVLFKNEESNFLGRTTLRASYETGSIDGTPPNVIPPANAMVDWFSPPDLALQQIEGTTFPAWVTDGSFQPKFILDNQANNYNRFNAPGSVIEPFFIHMGIVYNQPDARTATIGLPSDPGIGAMMGRLQFRVVPDGPHAGRTQQNIFGTRSFVGNEATPNFTVPTINDRNVFDNENHLISGQSNKTFHDFDAINFTLEQLLLDGDAGIEFAFDQQNYERGWQLPYTTGNVGGGSSSNDVKIDVTKYLTNGEENPNAGRPYVVFRGFPIDTRAIDRESSRVTGFYEIDFAEKSDNMGWLGRHVFSGLYNKQTIDSLSRSERHNWTNDSLDIVGEVLPGPLRNWAREVFTMVYLAEPQFGAQSWQDIRLADNISVPIPEDGGTFSGMYFNRRTGHLESNDNFRVTRFLNGANIDRQEVESEIFGWQSYFLDGHLVGLAGWRNDKIEIFSRESAVFLPDNTYDEANGLNLTEDPTFQFDHDTFTWSLVGHLPFDLPGGSQMSIHYAESENIQPTGVRRNVLGEEFAPPTGITTEYGFTFSMLENRLSARFNWFETNINGADAGIGGAARTAIATPGRWWNGWTLYQRGGGTIEGALEFSGGPEAVGLYDSYEAFFDAMISELVPPEVQAVWNYRLEDRDGILIFRQDVPPGATGTTDFVAEGFEFELVGNITPSWRAFLNISKQETIQDNTAPVLREVMAAFNQLLNTSPLGDWKDDPGRSAPFTFKSRFDLRGNTPLGSILTKDGSINPELRKWRANLATTYDFEQGFLRGSFAGGGIRWQDGVATGYPLILDSEGNRRPDITRPFFGPSELNGDIWIGHTRKLTDKINWKIQLNLRNAFGDSDPIPVVTNPDGNVAVIRNSLPKNIFLTNTFRF